MLVLLSLKLSYKLKTWLHQGWFVVLAHSEICWSIPSSSGTHSCISMVYSDGAESGRKIRSNQNVHESWSYLKSRESQTFVCWPHPSLWAIMHMILIWEWFRGMCCENHSNDLQKILGTGARTIMHKNFVVPEVNFRFHEDSELLRFSLSEWTDNEEQGS